jgi:hypothetical protein
MSFFGSTTHCTSSIWQPLRSAIGGARIALGRRAGDAQASQIA